MRIKARKHIYNTRESGTGMYETRWATKTEARGNKRESYTLNAGWVVTCRELGSKIMHI